MRPGDECTQQTAAVLISPNSESFGCKLRTTIFPRPDNALAFFFAHSAARIGWMAGAGWFYDGYQPVNWRVRRFWLLRFLGQQRGDHRHHFRIEIEAWRLVGIDRYGKIAGHAPQDPRELDQDAAAVAGECGK